MRMYMSEFQSFYNWDQEESLSAAQAEYEVQANLARLRESNQRVLETIVLTYHLASYRDFRELDLTNVISWMRRDRNQECQELVDKTILLTEYLLGVGLSDSERTENQQYIYFLELKLALIMQRLVAALYEDSTRPTLLQGLVTLSLPGHQ